MGNCRLKSFNTNFNFSKIECYGSLQNQRYITEQSERCRHLWHWRRISDVYCIHARNVRSIFRLVVVVVSVFFCSFLVFHLWQRKRNKPQRFISKKSIKDQSQHEKWERTTFTLNLRNSMSDPKLIIEIFQRDKIKCGWRSTKILSFIPNFRHLNNSND